MSTGTSGTFHRFIRSWEALYISSLFHFKTKVMRYYILKRGSEFVIYKVNYDDDEMFRKKYAAEILVEADSLMLVLLRFEREIMYSLDYTPAINNKAI